MASQFHFFTPKIFGSLLVGGGAASGGGAIYLYQIPKTWKELLVKEGYVFLNSEYDYKAMFNDQKENSDWQQETDLTGSDESTVKTNAEKYCNQLNNELPKPYGTNDENTKKKLIAFCTTDGIKTVKARLIQNEKTGWIDGSENADEKWKTVFAVYRYSSEFIEWLKKDSEGNENLNHESTIEDNYEKLKTACINLLKKEYRKVSKDHVNYGSWWCVALGYKTIEGKIKDSDENWSVKPQNDNDWEDLVETWKATDEVKKWAHKANGGEEEGDIPDLNSTSLKKLCGSESLNSKLSVEESYQEKYLVIKSVCQKK